MKRNLVRAGLVILLLLAALFVIGSIISARTGRQLNEAAKLQSLVVVIADELQDHLRKNGSFPSNLAELNLDQNKSFMALAREAPELSAFNYTSDGRTFRLTVKNMKFVPGFTGDVQEGLRPIHPSQE